MAANIIVNETLYVIQNYFGKVAENNLVTTITGFYEDDEVVGAKEVLFSVADSLKIDGLPRLYKRKEGNAKRRLDCEDAIALWKFMDKLPDVKKPLFAAVKANRVPSFSPSEVDIVSLTQSVISTKQQVDELKCIIEALSNKVDAKAEVAKSLPSGSNNVSPELTTAKPDHQTPTKTEESPTFADKVRMKQNGEWVTVARKPRSNPEPVRRLVGNGGDHHKIKAAQPSNPKAWHVFVGRMAPDTDKDDICDFLKDWQINVIDCSLLTRREKWHEKYAAFHVTIEYEFKDAIFDKVDWPEGVDVRDWAFKSRFATNTN